jgi:hypothetical protein
MRYLEPLLNNNTNSSFIDMKALKTKLSRTHRVEAPYGVALIAGTKLSNQHNFYSFLFMYKKHFFSISKLKNRIILYLLSLILELYDACYPLYETILLTWGPEMVWTFCVKDDRHDSPYTIPEIAIDNLNDSSHIKEFPQSGHFFNDFDFIIYAASC